MRPPPPLSRTLFLGFRRGEKGKGGIGEKVASGPGAWQGDEAEGKKGKRVPRVLPPPESQEEPGPAWRGGRSASRGGKRVWEKGFLGKKGGGSPHKGVEPLGWKLFEGSLPGGEPWGVILKGDPKGGSLGMLLGDGPFGVLLGVLLGVILLG